MFCFGDLTRHEQDAEKPLCLAFGEMALLQSGFRNSKSSTGICSPAEAPAQAGAFFSNLIRRTASATYKSLLVQIPIGPGSPGKVNNLEDEIPISPRNEFRYLFDLFEALLLEVLLRFLDLCVVGFCPAVWVLFSSRSFFTSRR